MGLAILGHSIVVAFNLFWYNIPSYYHGPNGLLDLYLIMDGIPSTDVPNNCKYVFPF